MLTFAKVIAGGLAFAAGAQMIPMPPAVGVVLGIAYMIGASLVVNSCSTRRI